LIEINKNEEEFITIVTLKDTTPTPPSELIDTSGENKLRVVFTNLKDNSERTVKFETETNKIGVNLLDSDTYNKGSEIKRKFSDLLILEEGIDYETNKRKKKKLQKEYDSLESEIESLISDNKIEIKINASFTKDENVTKQEKIVYEYNTILESWVLYKKTT